MTIHLVGVIHTDPKSEPLVTSVINTTQPDKIFLEVGEYRLHIMQSDSKSDKILTSFKERIINLRPRGRIVHSAVTVNQTIRSIISGSIIVGSVDMIPAIQAGENIGAEIIPIDMDQHQIMNELGRSIFSIKSLLNFNPRERIQFMQSIDFKHDITTIEGLSKIDHNMSKITPQRYNVLVTKRNDVMVQNIKKSMNINDTAVTIVGALHLPGMIKQLQNTEYDIEVYL